jgi:hypothetical protein
LSWTLITLLKLLVNKVDPNLPREERARLEAQLALAKENAESHFKLHGVPLCYAAVPQLSDASEDVSQPKLVNDNSELDSICFDSNTLEPLPEMF